MGKFVDLFSVISDFLKRLRLIKYQDEQSKMSFDNAMIAVDERTRLIRMRIVEQNEADYKKLLSK